MKRALLLTALVALPLTAAAGPRQRITVMDIRSVQGVSAGTATVLTAIVVDVASRAGFDVISQADVTAMIGFEKQKHMLGCRDDSSCLAEIGGALGVDYMLSGQVGQIGSRLHLSFQLLESRKAKVVGRAARFSNRDEDALAASAETTVCEVLESARERGERQQVAQSGDSKVTEKTVEKETETARTERKTTEVKTNTAKEDSSSDTLQKEWANPSYSSIYADSSGQITTRAVMANVLFAGGLATSGAGTWLLLKSRAPLAVAPSIGDGQVGLAAAGSF